MSRCAFFHTHGVWICHYVACYTLSSDSCKDVELLLKSRNGWGSHDRNASAWKICRLEWRSRTGPSVLVYIKLWNVIYYMLIRKEIFWWYRFFFSLSRILWLWSELISSTSGWYYGLLHFRSPLIIYLNTLFYSKVSRPEKLAVHVFEVDEEVDKDEVSLQQHPSYELYFFVQCLWKNRII